MEQPDKIEVLFNENHVLIRLNGLFTIDDLLSCFDYVVNHYDYKLGMSRIWELTNAHFEIRESDEIEILANYSLLFPPGINNVKVALVSDVNNNWILIQLFKAHTQNTKLKVEAFNSLHQAQNWVTTQFSK
jgi:hypothetical protein